MWRLTASHALPLAPRRWASSEAPALAGRMQQVRTPTLAPVPRPHPLPTSTRAPHAPQELEQIFGAAAPAPAPPPRREPDAATRKRKMVRRMVEHALPNYMETNFQTMSLVLTRAPKLRDFPHERVYTPEGIDLLFRHYYKNKRS